MKSCLPQPREPNEPQGSFLIFNFPVIILPVDKTEKTKEIIKKLEKLFPNSKIALNYGNPWELLVAVILSAQTTDKKVNEVTESLFDKYRTLQDYVDADVMDFQNDIHQIGLFRTKAKNIVTTAKIIDEEYKGRIPDTMEKLTALPGIGRKTGNVVLGNIYQVYVGIAVDTHVKRLTRLWGLTKNSDPNKIEKDLMAIVPKDKWFLFTYLVIDYGRAYCPAHCKHTNCPLRDYIEN